MPRDTRIALFLMGELVYALRANEPDLFKRWLSGGVQDLGVQSQQVGQLTRRCEAATG